MEMIMENQKAVQDKTAELLEFIESIEVDDYNINVEEVSSGTFKIATKEQANFFLKKLEDIKTEKDAINFSAEQQIKYVTDRVNTWKEKELKTLKSSEDYFIGLLQQFTLEELEKGDSKTKKIKLPYGTMGFRKVPDKFIYDDKELLAHLQQLEIKDCIRTKQEPDKTELKKKAVVKNGKLYIDNIEVKGVEVQTQEPVFEVK